ncbi:U5 small nuclear ribonucleoprotein [Oopsacas minuta]|uniref:U5 small nuclear ribonucleoprotein 200 kDa helicase n=1 Tax=Oopsacas minuta TaxID=111878 RepID=A0AAV7KBX2_9METZ|nr:U5 small nuclear ribonucleoprotein [Oopsacas minuta]
MANTKARESQYEYKYNSNLVLTADRSLIDVRRRDESTGEVKSLTGNLSGIRMGDKSQRSKPPEEIASKRHKLDSIENTSVHLRESLFSEDPISSFHSLPQSRTHFEFLLNFIKRFIGDQPNDVLVGAAEEIIMTINDPKISASDKHNEILSLLGDVTPKQYTELYNLITTLVSFSDKGFGVAGAAPEKEEMETNSNINVVFFEDSGDEIHDGHEVREEIDSEHDSEEESHLHSSSYAADLTDPSLELKELDPVAIDAYWLQRKVNTFCRDAENSLRITEDILSILREARDEGECENKLVLLLGSDCFSFIKLLSSHRLIILYCTLLQRASTDSERKQIEASIQENPSHSHVLDLIKQSNKGLQATIDGRSREKRLATKDYNQREDSVAAYTALNLTQFSFPHCSQLMVNKRCELPDGSYRQSKKGYEEVHVPGVKKAVNPGESLVAISSLPTWAQPAFSLVGYKSLNRIQSRLADIAINSDDNLLLCAPTGAGKTNVALLCILREVSKHLSESGSYSFDNMKIIYIAPMKSLVHEVVLNFKKRLGHYGIIVDEMTGDNQLSKENARETNIIVCTPEKWDIITRKGHEKSFTQFVRLIIIDEVHLLHDERGPVLESIVARTNIQIDSTQEHVRIVGLSATLPNFEDIAIFLKVDPKKGLFNFNNSYRPVPLEQHYIGITEKKGLKRYQLMNDVVYDKVLEFAGRHQVLVFVHSRKETWKTAKEILDMALQRDTIGKFLKEGSASTEVLRSEAMQVLDSKLKDLLPYGFAIHHAGLTKLDRTLVEDLFEDRHIQILFSTATLAWGVNLPAHAVIIKGTQVYSPEKGRWIELGLLNCLQMLGRAGRPQHDKKGHGILITNHGELQYYLSLMNQQLPIESHFIKNLVDNLNAEIVLNNVSTIQEGVHWLSYTYLFIRMLRNPSLYNISSETIENDHLLEQHRSSLIHTAALQLEKNNLIRYEKKTGTFYSTEYGRIASYFYLTNETTAIYNKLLKSNLTEIEIFRIFSLSTEFRFVAVRDEEKVEIKKLTEIVPVPIKEGYEEPTAKINVLLQVYISQIQLDGFALMSDMVYVTQSAGRLLRALFEVSLFKGWTLLAERCLTLCKMVEKRMWKSMTPFRQFAKLSPDVLRKIESKDFSWDRLQDLSHHEIGELVRNPRLGKVLHKLIHKFPKLELSTQIQPVTRSSLLVELIIMPDFQWDEKIHGEFQGFWILVEDVDGELLLHYEYFILKKYKVQQEHRINFFVNIIEPIPPQYFIRVISDTWIGSETLLPISFRHLILPVKSLPATTLLDLQPLPISALRRPEFESIYSNQFSTFNSIQTQTFNHLYNTDESILIGAPSGSGKTVCAELALLRMFTKEPKGRCLFVTPNDHLADIMYEKWHPIFTNLLNINLVRLTGDTNIDLKLIREANLIVSTPFQWDNLSRRWRQRKYVQNISMFIIDHLHLIDYETGPIIEIIASRMRFMSNQLMKEIRIIGLSGSVSNAKDLAQWLGISSRGIFAFGNSVRPIPLELNFETFNYNNVPSRLLAMTKPLYHCISYQPKGTSVLIFVPSKTLAKLTAIDILSFLASENNPLKFLVGSETDIISRLEGVGDYTLTQTLGHGVGYIHEGMSKCERNIVESLFLIGKIKLLIASFSFCFYVKSYANLVILVDTVYYDGRTHSYIDLPITHILHMIGRANLPYIQNVSKSIIFCQNSKKKFLQKFLSEPLVVESRLVQYLNDHLNAEIVTKNIENKQDAVDYITWTFLYRRLTLNPNFYGLQGTSHHHLCDFLSELIESCLSHLQQCSCLTIENEITVNPTNLGIIGAYFYVSCVSLEMFANSLKENTKIRGLIEIIASAGEFSNLPVRHNEDKYLSQLSTKIPLKLTDDTSYSDPHIKANLLLQAHISRFTLPLELQQDCEEVVQIALRLIYSSVDVLSSFGWLSPVLNTMELSQMITQAQWNKESLLKQLPFFSPSVIQECKSVGIESIYDLIELEEDRRFKLLQMEESHLAEVALFCNHYPNIELQFTISNPSEIFAGDMILLQVSLERAEFIGLNVIAPFFPKKREEGWWLVVGDIAKNIIKVIKRVNLTMKSKIRLEFDSPSTPGKYPFTLYLMSDSYLGTDQEYEFTLIIQ